MQIRHLTLQGYRNLARTELDLPPGLVAISGDNGQGKTNLLEAVYLLAGGVLPGLRLDALIARGGQVAFLAADLLLPDGLSRVEISIAAGRRRLSQDGVPARRYQLSAGGAVWLRPDDLELVYGAPQARRHYLDALLTRLSRRYGQVLSVFERALLQRNAALRAGLDPSLWEPQLSLHGAELIELRRRLVRRMAELLPDVHAELGGRGQLAAQLQETSDPGELARELAARREQDRQRGFTTIGPQRDDLLLSLAGAPAQAFSSRGEARTIALSLRRLEWILLSERYADSPLLLIDELSGELDRSRRDRLLQWISTTPQVVVTDTDLSGIAQACLRLRVDGGRVEVQE
jgi:DNA replication and repair protein RecF